MRYVIVGLSTMLLGLFLGALGILSYQKYTALSPIPTISRITPTPNPTTSWNVFTDPTEKFTFKYPTKYTIETQAKDDGSGMNYLFANDYTITLSVFRNYSTNQTQFFYDTPATGSININGLLWKTYYLPTGYGDGAVGEGKPIYGLQAEIQNHLVSITLFNQKNITDEQRHILSTFKFIENEKVTSCQYKGTTYWDGETFPDLCNTCSCISGQVACTLMACAD